MTTKKSEGENKRKREKKWTKQHALYKTSILMKKFLYIHKRHFCLAYRFVFIIYYTKNS